MKEPCPPRAPSAVRRRGLGREGGPVDQVDTCTAEEPCAQGVLEDPRRKFVRESEDSPPRPPSPEKLVDFTLKGTGHGDQARRWSMLRFPARPRSARRLAKAGS